MVNVSGCLDAAFGASSRGFIKASGWGKENQDMMYAMSQKETAVDAEPHLVGMTVACLEGRAGKDKS